jgi:hypothetical protein
VGGESLKGIALWLRAVVAVTILVGTTYGTVVYLNSQRVGAPRFGPGPGTSIYIFIGRLAGLILMTFIGIVASYIFERARSASDPVNLRAILGSMWTSRQFLMAMVASPIVFNAVYLIIGDLPQTVADYYLAFQNGFGWERIINGLGSTHTAVSDGT